MMTTQGLTEAMKKTLKSAKANREGAKTIIVLGSPIHQKLQKERLLGPGGGLTSRGVAMRQIIERETEDALFGGF